MPDQPLVSIITVTYNCVSSIEATIRSVIDKPGDYEYLIIDGGSSDGTKEIIERHKDVLSYWVSEPDKGVYDAINKGIAAAKGMFLYVINAGDTLLEIPYNEIKSAAEQGADVVLFPVLRSDNALHKSRVNWWLRLHNTIHHQGAFYARRLNMRYDTRYRVFADFDQNLKLYLEKRKFIEHDTVVAFHSIDGLSHNAKYFSEVYQIVQARLGSGYRLLTFLYFKMRGVLSRITPKSKKA